MASPREEARGSKASQKARAHQHVGFFRPYRKGGGKSKKGGKSSGSAAKANVAEEEVEEEEIEDDALLADKKKRKRKPQAKKKGKPQPAGSAAHEAEAAVDDDGFAYSTVPTPLRSSPTTKSGALKAPRESKKKLRIALV